MVTTIAPDANVTVTTKVLSNVDGKDFIENAHMDVKRQNGINTMINLTKKLNGETKFNN